MANVRRKKLRSFWRISAYCRTSHCREFIPG